METACSSETSIPVEYPGIFSRREVTPGIFSGPQQIQLRTEARENGDLGAVAPLSGVKVNLQMSETPYSY
jgi:hypothetical protein